AVVGVPVQDRGERVKAFIVLKDETAACSGEILDFCGENLAPYKVPIVVEFRDNLPMTSAGKVLRRVLCEEETSSGSG
ncbi:MAG: long-chain fatty acid--CoA ligase, partial [Anaerolineae bacterium]|nr:long-chain fatty acid--CoA ligase [Anaerolineae bacterium]